MKNDTSEKLEKIIQKGVVAIIRMGTAEKVIPLARAIVKGGVPAVEVTMNTPDALRLIREMTEIEGIIPGAGTVTSKEIAEAAIEAGAEYLVTPITKKEIIETAKKHGKPIFSGAFSPTEVFQAWEWGADIIKVFPASIVGMEYIKSLKGPFPHIKMMPTGGVSIDNIGQWLATGVSCVAIGGRFFDQELLDKSDWDGLSTKVKQFLSIMEHLKG